MKIPCTVLAAPLVALLLLSTGCSMSKMVVRGTLSIMDGSVDAMNRETDLALAAAAIPANLKLIEGLINEDPNNTLLREYAAQAFYGYSFGFIEDTDRQRASALYLRCLDNAQQALNQSGVALSVMKARPDDVEAAVADAGQRAVPGMFWTASCLAKWVDMNRDDPMAVDERFYYGGAHIFFGVYYGSVAPMFGGDYAKSEQHFAAATSITGGRLLMVDLMYAQFLARQRLDREAFHQRLTRVIGAPDDLYPEMALANAIARDKARKLLAKEDEWF
jgi:hypothetical protein